MKKKAKNKVKIKPEDMTPQEKATYKKSLMRFVSEPGDVKMIR
jgi:hypothetical protein